LKDIPSEIISNLVKLEELHVKNNPLIEIPVNLQATTKVLK
jgi:Leucine-rich repeat (LRR) protein